jgi:hypothetical protein
MNKPYEIIEEQPNPGVWMYHKELGPVLFHTPEELAEAGDGWQDTPVFEKPKPAKKFAPEKPLEKMNKAELLRSCLSMDMKQEEISALTNKELVALLK